MDAKAMLKVFLEVCNAHLDPEHCAHNKAVNWADLKTKAEEALRFAGIECNCGSNDTTYTGLGGYQEADPSKGLPEVQVMCNSCGREFWA